MAEIASTEGTRPPEWLPVTVTQFKVRWSNGLIDEVRVERRPQKLGRYVVIGLKDGQEEFTNEYDLRSDALSDINCLWWEYWERLLDEDNPGVLLEFDRERIPERWNRKWVHSISDIIKDRAHCRLDPSRHYIVPVKRHHRRQR